MTNSVAAAMVAALEQQGDPMQRLRALVARLGIRGRPSRKDRRAVLSLARQLGVEVHEPEPTGREQGPVLALPPAAESVIRRREEEWRELVRERFARAVARLQRSTVGKKVALQAKDLSAGARAIQIMGALEVDPNQVDTETLAWAGRLTSEDVKYLFRKDAALLPEEAVIAGAFEGERRRVSVILKSRVKRSALEGGEPTPLTTPVNGVEVDEATTKGLLGDYTEAVAQRAAVKRGLLVLWRQRRAAEEFPQEPPAERWARIAWLTFVGHALPPVVPAWRFAAREELRKELGETTLTANQLCASLEKARQVVYGTQARRSA